MIVTTDISIDIETLGTKPGARILQIAAAAEGFEPLNVYLANYPSDVCPETVAWWRRTDERLYRAILEECSGPEAKGIETARAMLFNWFAGVRLAGPVLVWAYSPQFDLSLIEHAFGRVPWTYQEERDLRTLVKEAETVGYVRPPARYDVAHDALNDARNQLALLGDVRRWLRAGRVEVGG